MSLKGSLSRCDDMSQHVGVGCGETFGPVVEPASIYTMLSLALSKSWEIHQLDVKNAFIHGISLRLCILLVPLILCILNMVVCKEVFI